ncbi:hypothetical protein [Actinoplanes sp. NPDC049265]|uniref:hypothetical protein n=1 Tax=Actinoplanes sp. NPDC049265 TaxID=3363902 RepID=UPI00371A3AF3
MRFFTNDNKDDDTDVKDRPADHPDDTVALPQQRGNSPWSSTPDSTEGSGSHRRDDEEPLITDQSAAEDPTPPDHAVADTSPDAAPDAGWAGPTGTTDGKGATLEDDGEFDDPKVVDADGSATIADGDDDTLRDEGAFDDPKAVDPATDEPIEDDSTDTADHTGTDRTDYTDSTDTVETTDTADTAVIVAEPVPVATDAAVTDAPAAADATTPADETPAAKPGEVAAPEVTTIFGADDAKAFQDRWRDVQLRFVDSPKEATAEAAALIDDAVEKLTAALRSQKDSFRGDSTEDTEKLRVELRGYREIFNRIIGL